MVAVLKKRLRPWSQFSENTATMIAVLRKILWLDHNPHKDTQNCDWNSATSRAS